MGPFNEWDSAIAVPIDPSDGWFGLTGLGLWCSEVKVLAALKT